VGVGEFVDGARRLGQPIVIEQRFDPGQTDFRDSIEKIKQSGADAVVLWGDAEETGAAVRQIREAGIEVPLFGYDRMAQPAFLKAAGAAAEGIVLSVTMNPDSADPAWTAFRQRYRERWGDEPDTYAAHAYDGMNLILNAIRQAGLNRPRVRDQLFALQSYKGASGDIVFDTNMSNVAPTWLATVQQGRFHYVPAPDWEQTTASTAPGAAKRQRP
jgi:ABC-type branched-subunit amino acid transport system substrate-binding protein